MKEAIKKKLDLIADVIYEGIETNSINNMMGVYNGNFGILLFLYTYSKYSQDKKFAELTDKYTDQLLETLGSKYELYTFCSGLSGILYLFEYLKENDFIDIDTSEIRELFDNYIIRCMNMDIQKGYYDFMHGALGAGLYFMKTDTHSQEIDKLLDFLYNTAEKDTDKNTFSWKSILGISGDFGYNIALSHGMSSIVLFLCRLYKKGYSHPYLNPLLNGTVHYLLSQEIDPDVYGSCFPSQSKENITKGRMGWCYGDLGVAYSIWNAGKIMKNKDWQQKSIDVFNHSITRKSVEDSMVMDAGICHGSSGIALFFNRMYQETKEVKYREARDYWLNETLNLSKFKEGLAGYLTYAKDLDVNPDYSLLTGIAGIGLVFLSYLNDDGQKWDELLLLSFPCS